MLVVQSALVAGVHDWFQSVHGVMTGQAVAAVAGVQELPVPEHR